MIFAIRSFSSKAADAHRSAVPDLCHGRDRRSGPVQDPEPVRKPAHPFVSMGMSNAIIRFGLDKGNSEKQVFTNGLLTILGGFGIFVLCWPVAQFLPDMAQYGLLIYLYVLMSCLRTLCTQFVRSRQWNKLVAVDGVLCTVATMAFYVLYLVGFKWGANGYLLAIISGDFVSVLFLMFTGKLWDFIELKGINKNLWKQMLRFSLPMIPAQISFWVINASDLFFVRGDVQRPLDRNMARRGAACSPQATSCPPILTTLGLIFYDAWQLSAVTEEEAAAPSSSPQIFPHLFQRAVLLCSGHHLALPPGHAHHEIQLLLCVALCALPDAGVHLQLLQPVPEQRLSRQQEVQPQPVDDALRRGEQLHHELFLHQVVGPHRCDLCLLPWAGAGVHPARHRRNKDDPGCPHPGRVLVNAAALVAEAFLCCWLRRPLYGLWTGLMAAVILTTLQAWWAMARILLPACWAAAARRWCRLWMAG